MRERNEAELLKLKEISRSRQHQVFTDFTSLCPFFINFHYLIFLPCLLFIPSC